MPDVWQVETYTADTFMPTLYEGVSPVEVVRLVAVALANGNTGGIAVYRPATPAEHREGEK